MKLLLTLAILFHLKAASGQIRMGITGGLNVSSTSLSSHILYGYQNSQNFTTRKSINGYFGALTADTKIRKSFLLKTQLSFSRKGWEEVTTHQSISSGPLPITNITDTKYIFNTLQIPISFMFTSPMASGRMYIGTGPYFGYAFSGDGGNTDSLFNKADYGIHSIVGFETRVGLFFEVGYEFGFSEVYKKKFLDNDTHYRCVMISAGWWLNLKKTGK